MSISKNALQFCGFFESELLLELMLRYWQHPFAADASFRRSLLESAAEVLRSADSGATLIEGLGGENMNLVAAIWYAESAAVSDDRDCDSQVLQSRQAWLETLMRALPSCFCDPKLLD